ncbi:hypothetical protein C818_00224 [Lachnospiraceae bacterium MD308]|nr:hypothetical protein C818_00224 [Lachnospiraceae bacterium MD308]
MSELIILLTYYNNAPWNVSRNMKKEGKRQWIYLILSKDDYATKQNLIGFIKTQEKRAEKRKGW